MRFDPRVLPVDSLAKYAAAFFKISFSLRSFARSCRNRVRSAYRSFTGGLANSWIAGSPLRARATQFSNVIPDISLDRDTVGTLHPPSITCPTPVFRNFPGELRFTLFLSTFHQVKMACTVTSIFLVSDHRRSVSRSGR